MREYKEIYHYEQYKICSRITKEKLERQAGGLKGKGSGSDQQLGESTNSNLQDLDMQI